MQTTGLIVVLTYKTVAKSHGCLKAKVIVGIYPGHFFYIIFTNFAKVDVSLPSHPKVVDFTGAPKQ